MHHLDPHVVIRRGRWESGALLFPSGLTLSYNDNLWQHREPFHPGRREWPAFGWLC